MKTSRQAAQLVCWILVADFDPRLLTMSAMLLAVLACGGIVLWLTFRWYRSLKQPPSITGEALAELDGALNEQPELAPEEIQRIKEAIQRQRDEKR